MIENMESMLGRKLTTQEKKFIDWILRMDKETIETFESIFNKLWREGQKDGMSSVFAHVLYDVGIDIREASKDDPRVMELADKYGAADLFE